MTAGRAIEMAEVLRPDAGFDVGLLQMWLRECDARLRRTVVERNDVGKDFDDVGADVKWSDGLEDNTVLLVSDGYDGLYPHWLAAQIDLALGETARASNELQQYADGAQSWATWMRRNYLPMGAQQWRY